MKATTPILAIAVILFALLASGCIFCCGLDSQLSKYKKSVSALELPEKVTLGGVEYHLVETDTRLNTSAAKVGIISVLGKLEYPPEDVAATANQSVDTSGLTQYRWFNYTSGAENGTLGVYVAKTDSPLVASSGFESLRQLLDSSTWIINNENYNWGGVSNVSHLKSTSLGDGGEEYRADVFGQKSYTVILKYSNMYVLAYSFESFDVAEEAARLALGEIDREAADP